jgi:hypothetical protein
MWMVMEGKRNEKTWRGMGGDSEGGREMKGGYM